MLTGSTPIYLSEDGRDAAVASVGLQMKYSKFYDSFMNSTRHCPRPNGVDCQETCFNDQIDCYLIDENGYVVLSENYKDVRLIHHIAMVSVTLTSLSGYK